MAFYLRAIGIQPPMSAPQNNLSEPDLLNIQSFPQHFLVQIDVFFFLFHILLALILFSKHQSFPDKRGVKAVVLATLFMQSPHVDSSLSSSDSDFRLSSSSLGSGCPALPAWLCGRFQQMRYWKCSALFLETSITEVAISQGGLLLILC